jgi:enoyl-CoA hydratase/carnithine racemase
LPRLFKRVRNEADPSVKAVVFQSANPDFFIAHLDVAKAAERPEALGLWRDFVLRLSSTPVVSIAKIRGRTRGIGNEFVLACDMRFASRQTALFGNPEVGVGLVPGGGALEWLPRLVGRSRALEIVLSGDDFDADISERYGWVNRSLDDDDLDSFVDTLVRRLVSFDRETLAAAKAQVNRFGTPTAAELQSSNDLLKWRGTCSSSASRTASGPWLHCGSERQCAECGYCAASARAGDQRAKAAAPARIQTRAFEGYPYANCL